MIRALCSRLSSYCRQKVLIRTACRGWSKEQVHTHTHTLTLSLTLSLSLPGLPPHFPVSLSSLLPGSGPHTEPTCSAPQCFHWGRKSERIQKRQGWDGEELWEKKTNVASLKGRRLKKEPRMAHSLKKQNEAKLFVNRGPDRWQQKHGWDSCILYELFSVPAHYLQPTVQFPPVLTTYSYINPSFWSTSAY